MIRITIELISAISPARNKKLGIINIANIGISLEDATKCDYSVVLSKWEPKLNEPWKRGTVRTFDNIKRGPYDLLYLALKTCLGNRNGEHKSLEQLEKESDERTN